MKVTRDCAFVGKNDHVLTALPLAILHNGLFHNEKATRILDNSQATETFTDFLFCFSHKEAP